MLLMTVSIMYIKAFISSLLLVSLYLVQADPTASVTHRKVDVKSMDNPYFGDWIGEINAPDAITLKAPVKADVPETMRLKATAKFEGSQIVEFDMPLCEVFDDEAYAKDVINHGTPKNKFPKKCPVKASNDYTILKYKFPQEKIPAGVPDGKVVVDASLYEEGKDPIVTVHTESELAHKMQGMKR